MMLMRGSAFVAGVGLGTVLFFSFFQMPSFSYASSMVNMNRYSGVVSAMDSENKTLTILVRDRYPSYGAPRPVRFTYDDETIWASFEYQFENDTVTRRKTLTESARDLPNGTMVTLVTRDEGGLLHIGALVFLRRTIL
jgi:hypothetical protein